MGRTYCTHEEVLESALYVLADSTSVTDCTSNVLRLNKTMEFQYVSIAFLSLVSLSLLRRNLSYLLFSSHFNLASDNHPSIWMQTLARYEATILTSQEHKTSRNLARLSRSSHRTRKLLLRFLIHRSRDQGRPNRARTNTVHSNPLLNLLVRQGAGESHNGALGRRIV
jgi:hypothetical protein